MMNHDYGIENFELCTENIRLIERPFNKQVLLVNTKECEGKITVPGMTQVFKGLGHFEWEQLLAYGLVHAVVQAIERRQKNADISQLFKAEYKASYRDGVSYGVTQERVHEHIMKAFTIVRTYDNVLEVRLKPECIK